MFLLQNVSLCAVAGDCLLLLGEEGDVFPVRAKSGSEGPQHYTTAINALALGL